MSRFSADDLAAAADDRTIRWRAGLPAEPILSREDQYLSEGRWHIQERNEAWSAGNIHAAWHEQLILDAFFAPVVAGLPGDRWEAEQRSDAATRAAATTGTYRSAAHPHSIYPWRPFVLWLPIAAIVTLIAAFGFRSSGRPAGAGQPA
jgi:hypothetical protein